MRTWSLASPDHTRALGAALGRCARPGDVVALDGELGAGKTCFAQGVGEGLGARGPITSPTFILLSVHDDGRLTLYHADLYRLGDGSELQELGLDEALGGGGLSLVEWASRFPEVLPSDHLTIQLRVVDLDTRALTASANGPRAAALLAALPDDPPPLDP